jgi:hypothetical protein
MLVVNRGRRLLRLDADTHRNLGSRGIVQLGVENLPAVGIFDVPIIGLSIRGNLLAALSSRSKNRRESGPRVHYADSSGAARSSALFLSADFRSCHALKSAR